MGILIAGLGLNKKSRKLAKYAAVAGYFASLKFSRKDEYEADKCSVKYTAAAGYNPYGLIDFFHKIDKGSNHSKIHKYFSTHPPTKDRIKAVKTVSTVNKTVKSSRKPTPRELKAAYESYLYYKKLYQYKVTQQAPAKELMSAFHKYQQAKSNYVHLKIQAGY